MQIKFLRYYLWLEKVLVVSCVLWCRRLAGSSGSEASDCEVLPSRKTHWKYTYRYKYKSSRYQILIDCLSCITHLVHVLYILWPRRLPGRQDFKARFAKCISKWNHKHHTNTYQNSQVICMTCISFGCVICVLRPRRLPRASGSETWVCPMRTNKRKCPYKSNTIRPGIIYVLIVLHCLCCLCSMHFMTSEASRVFRIWSLGLPNAYTNAISHKYAYKYNFQCIIHDFD